MKNIDLINVIAAEEFAGLIEGHITRFYGLCPECKKLLDKSGSLPDKSTNFAENKKEKQKVKLIRQIKEKRIDFSYNM